MNPDIFRAYDIRGIFGVDFEPKDFYQIARAFAARFQPKTVALGHDVRESSPLLWQQGAEGLQDTGVDVLNLGQISTDMLYFGVVHFQTDGGIIISASHNSAAYNGMKLVLRHALPLSSDTGLFELRDELKIGNPFENQTPLIRGARRVGEKSHKRGTLRTLPFLDAYLAHLRSFANLLQLSTKRIVINANSGLAGQMAERLLAETPIQICARLFIEPDGTFAQIPAGRPDPLRPENRDLTIKAVKRTGADLAVAWDADADRCFFFDETGEFVEGCYITALLAEQLLQQSGDVGGIGKSCLPEKRRPAVIFDPRAIWAVEAAVKAASGTPVLNRCGHSFIKARMRETDALFAGEASGHYYFRDNFYADNGMIPFLLVLEHLCAKGTSLAESMNPLRTAYPVSGEINFAFESRGHLRDAIEAVQHTIHSWGNHPCLETPIDGLSVRFSTNPRSYTGESPGHGSWRFNLRESNTEPLLRLNVETMGCENLLVGKTEMLSDVLAKLGGKRETKFRWEA